MKTILRSGVLVLALALAGCAPLPREDTRAGVDAALAARGIVPGPEARGVTELLASLEDRALGAPDAVRIALQNNPGLKAEYARLGIAAADVYEASRPGNPMLSASLMIPDSGHEADKTGFGIAQGFSSLLLLPARSRLAEGEYQRAKELITAQALQVAAETTAAHVRVAGAWQLLRMCQAAARAAEASAELARRYFAAGNISRLELAEEEAAASGARLAQMEAEAAIPHERAALNRLMGLRPDEDRWKVDDRLPAPPEAQPALDALLALADANRPELAAARREVSLAADALGVTRRYRLLGEVEAGVETERETDRTRLTGPTLGIELPIFDQGHGRVARAEARLAEAEAALHAIEVDLTNGVKESATALALARVRFLHYRDGLLPLREEIVRRMQREQNFMLKGAFELLAARQAEYEAWQGQVEALRDYWLARVELQRQIGTALPSEGGGA